MILQTTKPIQATKRHLLVELRFGLKFKHCWRVNTIAARTNLNFGLFSLLSEAHRAN